LRGLLRGTERFTTMSIFQRLYDSEINFEVSGFYDAGFFQAVGDAGRPPALANLIASLARTANPANGLALIEIGEAISASVRTLARVFSRAPGSAGPITFVPFTGVRGSDRSERHSEKRQRGNCSGEHPTLVHG